jgi:hypothetical protein
VSTLRLCPIAAATRPAPRGVTDTALPEQIWTHAVDGITLFDFVLAAKIDACEVPTSRKQGARAQAVRRG